VLFFLKGVNYMLYSLKGRIANSRPLSTDPTLTEEGASADAKATGEAIAKVKSDNQTYTDQHKNNKENPHGVTAAQLGLGLVDNTPDSQKPVSEAQAEAIADAKKAGTDAQEAAEEAKRTADEALEKALGKEGGSMEGDIEMGEHKITGVGTPESDTDAANKVYVDGKRFTATATIPATWSGLNFPYSLAVTVEGIKAEDKPHVSPVYSENLEDALKQIEAWSMVNKAVASENTITFYCYETKPDTEIPIQIEVNR
jgi:hypothetical protein